MIKGTHFCISLKHLFNTGIELNEECVALLSRPLPWESLLLKGILSSVPVHLCADLGICEFTHPPIGISPEPHMLRWKLLQAAFRSAQGGGGQGASRAGHGAY